MKRGGNALPLEVELDLSGEFSRKEMLKSSLGSTKESHLAGLDDFKQQGDVKLYSQLPDYDDFRGYDLGIDKQLEEIAKRIFVNLHKPS